MRSKLGQAQLDWLKQDLAGAGRTAGSIPTFKYSDALKSTHVTWDDLSLDKWLTDTESLIPDHDMSFHVPKADERAAIIRFLKVSSGK